MHHISKIRELQDDIAPIVLYLAIGVIEGKITVEEAAVVAHTYPQDFLDQVEKARQVWKMEKDNEDAISAALRGASVAGHSICTWC